MTKREVEPVPESMLPRPRQIESSDLKLGSCVDELVPALRSEIKKANGNKGEEIMMFEEEKAP